MSDIEHKTKDEGKAKGTGTRRYLSAEKKYQLFLEADKGEQQLVELLRREGLYVVYLLNIAVLAWDGAGGNG